MHVKIKSLKLLGNGDFEKIVGEVLRSLGVTTVVGDVTADLDELEIFNEVLGDKVITRIKVSRGSATKFFRKISVARPDERRGAEINRLVKRNLYMILVDNFGLDEVPYGILHGVRPTKIIQRWLDEGFGVTSQGVIDRDRIFRRICKDFLTTRDKAALLTEVALRQRNILTAVDSKTVSVYVGIPFCKTRCLYCSFPSHVLPAEEKIAEFMTVLNRDIDAAADEIKRYGFKVQSIYVGGGTPTALPEKFFGEMLAKVFGSFYGDGVEEFTVECGRPDTITAEKISVLKKFRITRVSVNPQSMHQKTLDFIGRAHTVEDVTRAFGELRAAGDFLINMDLILGLPGETVADFTSSLEKVLALAPDEITLHALALKRGSPLQMRLSDELNTLEDFHLPSDSEVQKMSELADKILRGEKFLPYYLYRQDYMSGHIENVGWRRRGFGIYNVQSIGERQTILGVGGAASTKVPDPKACRLQTAFNAKDLTTYMRDIERYISEREAALAKVYEPLTVDKEISDATLPVDKKISDATLSAADENISDVTLYAADENISDVTLSAVDEEISDVTLSAVDEKISDVTLPAADENISDVTLPVDEKFSDVTLTAVDEKISDVTLPAADENISDVTLPVDEEISDVTLPVDENISDMTLPVDKEISDVTLSAVDENISDVTLTAADEKISDVTLSVDEKISDVTLTADEKISDATLSAVDEEISDVTLPVDEKISDATLPVDEELSDVTLPVDEELSDVTLPAVDEEISDATLSVDENISDVTLTTDENISDVTLSAVDEEISDVTLSVDENISDATLSAADEKISDATLSAAEKLSDVTLSAAEKISDISLTADEKISDVTLSAVDEEISDVTLSAVDEEISDVTLSAVDENISDATLSAVDENISDATLPVNENISDVTLTADEKISDVTLPVDEEISDVTLSAVDEEISDATLTAADENISDVTLPVDATISDVTLPAVDENISDDKKSSRRRRKKILAERLNKPVDNGDD